MRASSPRLASVLAMPPGASRGWRAGGLRLLGRDARRARAASAKAPEGSFPMHRIEHGTDPGSVVSGRLPVHGPGTGWPSHRNGVSD
jgi:hypothetical protein